MTMLKTAMIAAMLLAFLAAEARADPKGGKHHGRRGPGPGHGGHSFDSRVIKGFEIAPVPLDLRGKNRAKVGLGSYIVNALGGCNDCHTAPPFAEGGDPYQGEPTVINADRYLAGGTPFGPTLVSPNITPDENGDPGGLSREEFVSLMRTGRDPHDDHILQVMPWPLYANMTDRDLHAVYEYLRAIPSLPDAP